MINDNSVVMTWCFKDETSQYADAILDSLEIVTGFVPSIWPLEVGNVLLVAERNKRLSEADSCPWLECSKQQCVADTSAYFA